MCEQYQDEDSVHKWQDAGTYVTGTGEIINSKHKFCLACGKVKLK